MSIVAAFLLAAQGGFIAYPPPALPPAAGTEPYAQFRAHQEADLRQACFSDAAVRLLADWEQAMARSLEHQLRWRRNETAVAEAAYAEPFDPARMEQALREQAEIQAAGQKRQSDAKLAMLARLSGEDRAIFARRQTVARPATPARVCGPNGASQ